MRKPEWLLFDLGGLLINVEGVSRLSRLTGMTPYDTQVAINSSNAILEFELGKLDPREFARTFSAELKLDLPSDTMLTHWADCEGGPKPGAFEYLRKLGREFRLACVSNTSVTHWERMCERHKLDTFFDKTFLSYQIGLCKPDKRIFEYVTRKINVVANKAMYFDDRQDIIDVAVEHGFDAHQAASPQEIEAHIKGKRPEWP